jgi:hypothetical protein
MEIDALTQAIGSVGFPIVACCGLFWMINTTMKEFTSTIGNLNTSILNLTSKIEDDRRATAEIAGEVE